mmetsp:Transcript_37053/g.63625  ORF Transcript_37053/g.63625 Transcript_37053/m.63625 type:complete len:228 (+) Transcript_37053:978-1661(+)
MVAHPLERLLQVGRDELAPGRREPLLAAHRAADKGGVEELDALHLVEGGEVRRVDLVSPVHVARAQEGLLPLAHQRRLMRRRVRAQQHVLRGRDFSPAGARDVIGVRGFPPRVVLRDQQVVEALLRVDDGIQAVDDVKGLALETVEVGLDLLLDDAEWVVVLLVQVAPDKVLDVRSDVVARFPSDEARRSRGGRGVEARALGIGRLREDARGRRPAGQLREARADER